MKSKIKRTVTAAIASLLLAVGGMSAVALAADTPDIQNSTCQGSTLQFNTDGISGSECSDVTSDSPEQINSLIATIINIFSIIVGIVAVIMIIYGGFRYITSGGDSGKVTDSRNTIIYAIIGLIIVALAQFIVKFVLAKATGQDG